MIAAEEGYCDGCGNEVNTYTMVQCWVHSTTHCEDCVDAHGFPCECFRSDWEG